MTDDFPGCVSNEFRNINHASANYRRPPTATMGNTSSAHKISAQDKLVSYLLPALFITNLFSFRAILDMKNQRDKLHQYQRRITVLTSRETEIAKEMLAKGDKPRALLALRRKKYQESL